MFFKIGKSKSNIICHKIPFAFDFAVEIQSIGIVAIEVEEVSTVDADFLSVWTGGKLQTGQIQIE